MLVLLWLDAAGRSPTRQAARVLASRRCPFRRQPRAWPARRVHLLGRAMVAGPTWRFALVALAQLRLVGVIGFVAGGAWQRRPAAALGQRPKCCAAAAAAAVAAPVAAAATEAGRRPGQTRPRSSCCSARTPTRNDFSLSLALSSVGQIAAAAAEEEEGAKMTMTSASDCANDRLKLARAER